MCDEYGWCSAGDHISAKPRLMQRSIRSLYYPLRTARIVQEYHYFKVYDNQNVEYILISKGSSDDAYMIGKVAVCEIQNLIIAYKERLDKNNFIQNLLLDNLLLVDVYNRAKSFASIQMRPRCLAW